MIQVGQSKKDEAKIARRSFAEILKKLSTSTLLTNNWHLSNRKSKNRFQVAQIWKNLLGLVGSKMQLQHDHHLSHELFPAYLAIGLEFSQGLVITAAGLWQRPPCRQGWELWGKIWWHVGNWFYPLAICCILIGFIMLDLILELKKSTFE